MGDLFGILRRAMRCCFEYQFMLALMVRRRQLEAATAGPFDRAVSRQLDAVEVLLDEIGGRQHENA